MVKMYKSVFFSLAILLVLVGCNNDTSEENLEENGVEEHQDEEPTTNDENDSEEVTTDPEDESDEADEDDSTPEDTASSDGILKLGETGLLETAIGNFEVTPTTVRFLENVEEEKPYNGTFIVVDLTVENVGSETIISEDVVSATLHSTDDSGSATNFDDFEEINNFEGEIEPGESMVGEIIFDFRKMDDYQISFGASYLDSLSNEVRWEFYADEAE